jgi:hypothetical protein
MPPDLPNFSMESEQIAEYEWQEQFDGRVWPIKARVFFVPFELNLNNMLKSGKYNASVLIGRDWQPFGQCDYEPSEAELKGRVKAQMPVWKAIGTIY